MIKIGVIHHTNSYPLFHALHNGLVPSPRYSFCSGTPVDINRMLRQGEVDIALISSIDFLKNRFAYILLSDFGIAATGPVLSVRLFFKTATPELDGQTVYVPSSSASSTRLFKILCRYFWNSSPKCEPVEADPSLLFSQDKPFLLVGDQCLASLDQSTHRSIDLSEAWHKATTKSFVFAVVATRNDSFRRDPKAAIEFHKYLDDSFAWWQQHQDTVIHAATQKSGCQHNLIKEYYSLLEHRISSKHIHGMEYFSTLEA